MNPPNPAQPAKDARDDAGLPSGSRSAGPWATGRAAARRFLVLAGLWWALAEGDSRGFGFGLVAVAAGTATSLALRPARRFRVTPAGLGEAGRFAVFFGRASLLGAVDVARRAFRRHVHLDPDFVRADLDVRGAEAALVALVVSLLPGTVAVALGDGWIRIHVLDRSIPATRHLAEVEERVLRLTAS